MDKLNRYRQIIQTILTQYHELDQEQPAPGIDSVLALDEVRDHYFWFQVGWDLTGRTCGSTVYIRIHNDKVWVEEDLIEDGIVGDLLQAGIPKEDIVLGFQHPRERAMTEFAVA
ncbi:MAG: XisI protein [Oculatellaceae cyanobacterium Prado106]|nr:XisI protein [Oculatellaceae cyanobacterium Prado106]